ncbi:MAG TPA: sigma-70 family RNA polymerase sigma factor [Anaerolineae bacterium]|nr:sigma-70 family RNA polymerase sigma factor [Anaerolineae bacterium]
MVSDEVLVAKAKIGTKEAFEELVKRYRALVYHAVLQVISSPQEAEDTTQEVFVSAFSSLESFDPQRASFKTWLFSIVKRRCVDWLRNSKKAVPMDEFATDVTQKIASQPEKALEATELKDALKRAFVSLSEEQRLCLALQSLQGFSYKEIAEIMDIPIGTVRSRIANARKKLLESLSDNVEDDAICAQ